MIRIQRGLVVLCLTLLPTAVSAQPNQEGPWRDRARMFLVLRIADALNLSEQDALKVSTVIRESDEHRGDLVQQRQTLEQELREALAKQPPDAATLTKLINQGNDIDQKLALVPEDSFHNLQKILTVEQQAKLMLFRRELQGEIRRAVQGRGRAAGGGRRGRGAPQE
jgi:Spy/CpxP family protein refolding chaperone